MSEFTFVIEGRGLGSALAEMERSDFVAVLGPHIARGPGAGPAAERMVVVATARDCEAAEELLWEYLGPSRNYAVSVEMQSQQAAT